MRLYQTIIGVPFFDGEGLAVLEACLANIDACATHLSVEAKIVVGINGPRVENGLTPLAYQIDPARYATAIEFIRTPPGLVNAERTIARHALEEGVEKIFFTDADITRMPHSLQYMWLRGIAPVVGASYAAYPLEVLDYVGVVYTPQERMLYKIFEATKHPIMREVCRPYQPVRRLKGSLILVQATMVEKMFGDQVITSDSRMNHILSETQRQLVPDAAFLFYGRTDLTDHVQARLRHFRAAFAAGSLDEFAKRSWVYTSEVVKKVVNQVSKIYPNSQEEISNFLTHAALEFLIIDACKKIVTHSPNRRLGRGTGSDGVDIGMVVRSYDDALIRAEALLGLVDWEKMDESVTNGEGVTNNRLSRSPLDVSEIMHVPEFRAIILSHLGLPADTIV